MVKKMTVLPTHLYNKLIKQDDGYNDHLKQQKDEILSWQLPPELTTRFYQDVVRSLAKRKDEETFSGKDRWIRQFTRTE